MRKRTYLRLAEQQEEQVRRHLEEVRGIYKEMRDISTISITIYRP